MNWQKHDFLSGIVEVAQTIMPRPRFYLHVADHFNLRGLFDSEPLILTAGENFFDNLGGKCNFSGALPHIVLGEVAGVSVMVATNCRTLADGGGVEPVLYPDVLAYHLGARNFIYIDTGISLNPDLKPGKWAMLTDFMSDYAISPLDGLHPFLPEPYPNLGDAFSQYLNSEIINSMSEKEPAPLLCTALGMPGYAQPTPAAAQRAHADGADIILRDLVLHLPLACALQCRTSAMVLAVAQMLPGTFPRITPGDFADTADFCSTQLIRTLRRCLPEIE